MTDIANPKAPSGWKYIGVWTFASLAGGLAIRLTDGLLMKALVNPTDLEGSRYWYIAPPVEFAAWALAIIAVYSIFRDLMMSKVMPWLIGLGLLGLIVSIGRTYSALTSAEISVPPIFPIAMMVSFGLAIVAVHYFFKLTQPKRY